MLVQSCGFFHTWYHKKDDRNNLREVVCFETQEVWTLHRDTPSSLRIKFIQLLFTNCVVIPFAKTPLRIWGIIKGDFIKHGTSVARRAWINEFGFNDPKNDLKDKIRSQIGKELILEVIKIALFLFEVVALTFAAIIGLIHPYEGRKLYADVERAFSRPRVADQPFHFSEYTAPCMQPDSIQEEKNLRKLEYKCGNWVKKPKPGLDITRRLKRYHTVYESLGIDVDYMIYKIKKISLEIVGRRASVKGYERSENLAQFNNQRLNELEHNLATIKMRVKEVIEDTIKGRDAKTDQLNDSVENTFLLLVKR